MTETPLRESLNYMHSLGVFDTVLPFLLVFTLIFAFLEKTKVLGTEKYKDGDSDSHDIPKKNLNAMTAFVIAFFAVASSQMVGFINEATGSIVLVIFLIFSFMLTVGSFSKQQDEPFFLEKPWDIIFQVIAFVAILLIFLNAMGWLDVVLGALAFIYNAEAFAMIAMLLIVVAFVFFIVADFGKGSSKGEKE